ncbi:MAG: hypothetical protein IT381_01110 [Deltaproteobacteria bacterium]|nr:hypothetical protein [Deltaproteobacteria bacterium]
MRVFFLAVFLCTSVAHAQPMRQAEVPEPLKPWVPWVLFEHKDFGCPIVAGEERGEGDDSSAGCAWQSRLELELGQKRGTFSFRATAFGTRLVALPGNEKHWPLDVKVDGKAALVVSRDGMPFVELASGAHTLSGVFAWDALPESLAVPGGIALVGLSIANKRVRFPEREDDGTVFLAKAEDDEREEAEENRLDLVVHRKVADDLPVRVDTRIELFASGKAREVTIGPVLLADFVPLALTSPLPARIEQDGQMRIQVRPGRFVIEIAARHPGNVKALQPRASQSLWVPEEVWVFQSDPNLRLVDVEGVDTIDPQQTTLPAEWRRFQTFRVRQGETMRLVEKRRGNAEPEPDKLVLERSIWLDFDGGGYTFRDRLSGVKNHGTRLEMQPGFVLGRVSASGADQFITRVEKDGLAGVQVPQGHLAIEADSRLDDGRRSFSAVSWAQDLAGLSAQLHLPPGWRLFAVSGADSVPGTWFSRWSLLELFLVMIVTLAVLKLYGVAAAAVACAALVLSVPENHAPQVLWLIVLAAEALVRVVPLARVKPWLKAGRGAAWVALAFAVIPFITGEVRQALYPTLEHENQTLGAANEAPRYYDTKQSESFLQDALVVREEENAREMNAPNAAPPRMDEGKVGGKQKPKRKMMKEEEEKDKGGDEAIGGERGQGIGVSSLGAIQSTSKGIVRQKKAAYTQNLYAHDPKAIVQTGPGVPAWQWNTFRIGFSGPVTQKQELRLFLLPPWFVALLGFLRALLVFFLFVVLLGFPGGVWPAALKRRFVRGGAAALILFASTSAAAADFPSKETLDELQQRLTRPPLCGEECATIGRMNLEVQGGVLRLRMEVSAAVRLGVPLPVSADQWLPERVSVDEKVGELFATEDGQIFVLLEPGLHRLVLEGALPERDSIQLPMVEKPHFVEARTAGWTVDGLHEDGEVDEILQLSRTEQRSGEKKAALQQGSLPPFSSIERHVELGLSWQIETTVRRATPLGTAIVLEVPLVDGESVTSEGVRVEGQKALVNMGPQDQELVWRSVLKERPEIVLKAKTDAPWTEIWRIDASSVWHFDVNGFAPVRGGGGAMWRPWPGESITVKVRRPEGVEGQTLTIDRSTLTFRPGLRTSDATLVLQMRSSRGGQHAITLPEGATVQSVKMNQSSQPIRQVGRALTLPLSPGSQTAEIEWREERGLSTLVRSPEVDLGRAAVNAELYLQVPSERWLLLAPGDGAGPAVLFWGALVLIALVAFVMGKVSQELAIPVTALHWFLLGLGLTQVELGGAFVVYAWFVLLALRQRYLNVISGFWYDAAQLAFVGLSMAMFAVLFSAIRAGLVVDPDMQVLGNGASSASLRWYIDRSAGVLPKGSLVSVPIFIYRVLMLAWALWLARALIAWLKWGFAAFAAHGFYRPFEWRPWRWWRRAT